MPILTEEEAEALDEELTRTIPEANQDIEGISPSITFCANSIK